MHTLLRGRDRATYDQCVGRTHRLELGAEVFEGDDRCVLELGDVAPVGCKAAPLTTGESHVAVAQRDVLIQRRRRRERPTSNRPRRRRGRPGTSVWTTTTLSVGGVVCPVVFPVVLEDGVVRSGLAGSPASDPHVARPVIDNPSAASAALRRR